MAVYTDRKSLNERDHNGIGTPKGPCSALLASSVQQDIGVAATSIIGTKLEG